MHTPPPGRWITPALLGVLLGTALQLQQRELWTGAAYASFALIVLLVFLVRRVRSRSFCLFVFASLLVFALCGLRSLAMQADSLDPAVEGSSLRIRGIVASMPQRTDQGTRFRFDVESAQREGRDVQAPPHLWLGWYAGEGPPVPQLRAGERWALTVRLKAPHGSLNPQGFDFELWMWEQGLQATGYVRAGARDEEPQRIEATAAHPLERARQAVRDAVFENVADRRSAGIIAALVVGDQNAIERGDWDVFRATGVAHLMSISGLHITMFAWAAGLVLAALWRRSARLCLACPVQHAALVGGWLLACAYALFSGWGVPAQRTVCMLAAVGLLRLSGRRWPWPQVWLLACAVVLLVDPWALMQAGFWLSFVAVGVLFATDAGAAGAAGAATWKARLARAWREQWVVTLALTPLSLLLFGQVSVVGLAANAVAIPWVTLVVTPLAMGGALVHALWVPAALAVDALAVLLQWLASLPFAAYCAAAAPLWAAALGLLGGVLLAMPLPLALRAMGLPLLLPVVLWQAPRPPAGEFELLFADVGQGNAVVVRTAAHALVYDAGPRYGPESDAGHRVLLPLLRSLGERVDLLVLSHRDTDHTGGARAVLEMQPAAGLLSSLENGHELLRLRASRRCEAGQAWTWDGIRFEVLHPRAADYLPNVKPNAISCVLRISNGRSSALLAGDIEAPQERQALESAQAWRADLLLVPHHGSRTSSTEGFLDAVHPALAIVQSGWRNRFGHPAPQVLVRYRERGIRVVDSPHCGAASWSSQAPSAVRCERDAAARYWHHRVP